MYRLVPLRAPQNTLRILQYSWEGSYTPLVTQSLVQLYMCTT